MRGRQSALYRYTHQPGGPANRTRQPAPWSRGVAIASLAPPAGGPAQIPPCRPNGPKRPLLVKSKGLPLTYILISHGHTDHFTGMDLFHKEFPLAKIVVANEGIKRDIKSYATTYREYIDDFTCVTSQAKSRKEAMAKMIARYPGYKQADFFLKYSVDNHVK